MTNLQLVLTIAIPSLLILVGMFLNNSRSNTLEGHIDRLGSDLDARIGRMGSDLNARIDRMGSDLNARLDRQQSDLSLFYQTLGRHDAEITNLKDAQRRA